MNTTTDTPEALAGEVMQGTISLTSVRRTHGGTMCGRVRALVQARRAELRVANSERLIAERAEADRRVDDNVLHQLCAGWRAGDRWVYKGVNGEPVGSANTEARARAELLASGNDPDNEHQAASGCSVDKLDYEIVTRAFGHWPFPGDSLTEPECLADLTAEDLATIGTILARLLRAMRGPRRA